jgi:hypothetical protein
VETLLALLLILYAVKHAVTDCAYAVRGKVPPRVAVRLAELRAGDPPAGRGRRRYGMRGYLSDLWADAWADARTSRDRRRAAKHPGGDSPASATSGDRAGTPAQPDKASPVDLPEAPAVPEPAAADRQADRPDAGGVSVGPVLPMLIKDPRARAARIRAEQNAAGEPAPSAPEPVPQAGALGGGEQAQGTQTPAAPDGPSATAPPAPDSELASVTPITTGNENNNQEVTAVSGTNGTSNGMTGGQVNGETTTLTAAKQYATDMSRATTGAQASIEQTIAHLSASEVEGAAIARFTEAQELAAALTAKLDEAHAELAKQDAVKDAYQSVPEAGNKQFLTQE